MLQAIVGADELNIRAQGRHMSQPSMSEHELCGRRLVAVRAFHVCFARCTPCCRCELHAVLPCDVSCFNDMLGMLALDACS